ncbi:MAG: 4Fe-4S binding protein [Candidatus Lindowbacteria bacterium]|nr:4Fe-4S binding protein [Candidatus Lindowbacteria bacterium]
MPGTTVVRAKICTACKTCEVQCAITHSQSKDLFEAIRETPLPEARIGLKQAKKVVVPVVCRHCENPPCVATCPEKALYKNGAGAPTLLDAGKCTGCGVCIEACPVGALQMDRAGKIVLKCDQCVERQREGLLPACVSGCPTGALEWHTGRIQYEIDPKLCKACGMCIKVCPVEAITGAKKTPHVINVEKCIKCGNCFTECPFDAINVVDV